MFPLCPFGGYGSALSSLVDAIGDFREKISLRTRVINCFECNVKHELPNFDIHLHCVKRCIFGANLVSIFPHSD